MLSQPIQTKIDAFTECIEIFGLIKLFAKLNNKGNIQPVTEYI